MSARQVLLLLPLLLLTQSVTLKRGKPSQTVHKLMYEEQHHSPFSPMLNLGHNVFNELQQYECARKGGDCTTYKALAALLALGRRGKDCYTDKDFPMCKIAQKRIEKILGQMGDDAVDVDSLYPLVLGQIKEDIPYIRGVFTALEGFICHKEGTDSKNCEEFKGIHSMYEYLNSVAEEGQL